MEEEVEVEAEVEAEAEEEAEVEAEVLGSRWPQRRAVRGGRSVVVYF